MKKLIYLATIMLIASCKNSGTVSNTVPAIDTANFDKSIALNDDFYQFATGGWQKMNPLRDEFARYGAFDVLRENNEIRLNDLFKEMTTKQSAEGTVDKKICDLYKMGLDSVRLNKEGYEPVKKEIDQIMQMNDKNLITNALVEMHKGGASTLFTIGVDADLLNSKINTLYISQGGIGMGNKEYYLNKENENIKNSYIVYLNKLFTLAGYSVDEAKKIVDDDMEVEMALAKSFFSNVELRDIEKNYNPMKRADFLKKYSAIDWEKFFTGINLPKFDEIVVGQMAAMEGVNNVVKNMPIEKIKHYFAVQTLDGAASYLSDAFSNASFEFYGKVMSGTKEQKPRWKRAMQVPNSVLGEAVGEMYVAKYFKKEDKEKMTKIVKNLQKSLSEHIAALDWMSDSTKAKAQEKLATFTIKIGYPDKWKDYSTLTIDSKLSYWENIKNASAWYIADNLKDLGKPVDKAKWYMSPQTVNAYYNPTSNEICFPAAILQPPFYNSNADDAVNYGAIGVVIGHEMTHGFDDQGRLFDKDGNMKNWWTPEDSKAFKAKTDLLVKQFDSVKILPGLNANGALSLGENIADQGGLRIAYTAMKNAQKGVEPANIDGYTGDQRFYLAYAQVWAQNIRDEEAARLTKEDVHSLGKNRVNVSLRNIETFFKAFDIKSGAMFRPESERVIIW